MARMSETTHDMPVVQKAGEYEAEWARLKTELRLETAGVSHGFQITKMYAFLAAFARSGNISQSSQSAGISNTTYYNWLERFPTFSKCAQVARQMAADFLESVAMQRAVNGWDEPVYQGGELVGFKRKFDNRLLQFLLQGANPSKYGAQSNLPAGNTTVNFNFRSREEVHEILTEGIRRIKAMRRPKLEHKNGDGDDAAEIIPESNGDTETEGRPEEGRTDGGDQEA